MFSHNSKYRILTKDGFKDFAGIKQTKTDTLQITVVGNNQIKTTLNHEFDTPKGKIEARLLTEGDEIITKNGVELVTEVLTTKEKADVYDIIEVEGDHTYLANNISVSNCAFVEHWSDFFASVYPTIASGKNSRIVLVSTANGLNHFYKIVTDARNGKNDFKLIEVTWRDVPGRDDEWRRQTIANTSEEAFLQEHENHFLGSSLTLISSSKLRTLVEEDPIILNGSMRIYKEPVSDHVYVIPVDTSRGKGLDKSAFSVVDITTYPFEQVATFYDDSISPLLYPSFIETVAKKYNMSHILVETNDIGESVATTLHYDLEYENILSPAINGKYQIGVRTTKSVKAVGCSTFRDLMENDRLIVHDKNTIVEMSGFIQKGSSYEADAGFHDDLVMGLVLFSWLTCQTAFEEFRQDFSLRKTMFGEEAEQFSEDLMPAAYIDDGVFGEPTTVVEDGVVWTMGN